MDRTWRTVCDCNKGGNECDQTCVEDSVDSEEVYYQMALVSVTFQKKVAGSILHFYNEILTERPVLL